MKQITKTVQQIGNGGHIYLPKELIGNRVIISLAEKSIEEIEERIFAGLPEEDRSYFEDATFAKKGGIVALQTGSIPHPGVPGGVNPHVGGIGYIQGYDLPPPPEKF